MMIKRLNLLWYWAKYPFKLIVYQFIDLMVMRRKAVTKPNTLLIFRLDLVGDYVMSRSFFAQLNAQGRFKGFEMSLACNEIYKDIALAFDAETFGQFYFLNRARFLNDMRYRFRILSEIRAKGFEVAICPMHTRQFLLESVVKCSGAKLRIGSSAVGKHMFTWQQKLADAWYNELIINKKYDAFEFDRNLQFFSKVVGEELTIRNNKFTLDSKWMEKIPSHPYILFAPGASVAVRRWSVHNFALLANALFQKYGWPIFIIGSRSEHNLYREIASSAGSPIYIQNLCGTLSLPEVFAWIANAKLLVGNESAPIHIAATGDCPTICLSNGTHFKRWNPYSPDLAPNVKTVYSKSFLQSSDSEKEKAYAEPSHSDISEITPHEVLLAVNEMQIE